MDWLDESRWADIHTFRHTGLRFDPASGVAELDYAHEGAGRSLAFTDTITFPLPPGGLTHEVPAAFRRALELLYVAVGTYYYKAVAPGRVVVDAVALAPAAARWAGALYRRGLAEFAHRWTLEHVLDLEIQTHDREPVPTTPGGGPPSGTPVVAIGGGKDSIVALEVLRGAGMAPATFALEREPTPVLGRIMATAPGPALLVRRRPDPEMIRMLRENVLRVGHVPVTAITSLAGVAVAALHGLGPVVMANERSSDEGNVVWRGREVNHQWSKGAEAERLLDAALTEHAGRPAGCFSLLRGLSELAICRLFAATRGYDELVTSCNFAFRMSHQARTPRWCADCAKCRFVFLALAPFVDRARLVGVVGHDLLADPAQVEGYRELVGLAGHKPFECVGEVAETRVAAGMLAGDPRWRDAVVVADLAARLPPVPASATAEVWRVDPVRSIPPAYREALAAWVPPASAPHGGS